MSERSPLLTRMEPPPDLGLTLEMEKPLAPLTTMRVGGPADYFATVSDTHQLIRLIRWAHIVELPYLILGGGSNILISDKGVRGLVIVNRCRAVRIDAPPCCDFPADDRPYLFAEGGAALAGAARMSVKAGLTGFEWAVSVPGSVGGAVVNNAGAHDGEIKDSLEDILLIDAEGSVESWTKDDLAYTYRKSALKGATTRAPGFEAVVLSANFRLVPAPAGLVEERARRFLGHRRATQPVEPSLGSTFTNPPGDFAGRLIEAAGLKGLEVGGAKVSPLHANFLINPGGVGGATATDVRTLLATVRRRVEESFGVRLETEIQFIGEWSGDENYD